MRVRPLTKPCARLRAHAVTRHVREQWPALRAVLDLRPRTDDHIPREQMGGTVRAGATYRRTSALRIGSSGGGQRC
jgi:hypothetical protein